MGRTNNIAAVRTHLESLRVSGWQIAVCADQMLVELEHRERASHNERLTLGDAATSLRIALDRLESLR